MSPHTTGAAKSTTWLHELICHGHTQLTRLDNAHSSRVYRYIYTSTLRWYAGGQDFSESAAVTT